MRIILPKQIGTKEGNLLFKKSEKIEDFDEGREIVNLLKESLERYRRGVGLAAPQLGISKRVFIINIRPTENHPKLPQIGFRAYLNPEILSVSSETNRDFETCLSVFYATLSGIVERPSYVKLKYLSLDGEEQIEDISHPFQARIVLHEYDHLEGKVFLQRMRPEDFSKLIWQEQLDLRKRFKGSQDEKNS